MNNLMVMKASMGSDVMVENLNNNKIRVRVPPVTGTRKIQLVPSAAVAAESSKTTPVCDHLTSFLRQNCANFSKSGEPARIMFYRNRSWVDFEKEVFDVLKLGFSEGKPVIEAVVDGQNCLIDFLRMLKFEFGSVTHRSIAWIDVNGKCFFPKLFVDTSEDSEVFEEKNGNGKEKVSCEGPMIEIEIKIGGEGNKNPVKVENLEVNDVNLMKRKRVIEENERLSSSNNDVKRRQISETVVKKPLWPKTKVLTESDNGYTMMKNAFLAALANIDPGVMITAIHKCSWSGLMDQARYEIFEKQTELCKRNRGDARVRYAWYGTSAKGVETVLAHGFGAPSKCSGLYGVGVYLSPAKLPQISANFSEPDERGERHLVLCRVILGKCEKVAAGSMQAYPSSVDYDNGVDDLESPKVYVVWSANMNTHIIPEYVVSYKLANSAAGQVNGCVSDSEKMFIARLYSKLSAHVPPSRVKVLEMLCTSYTDGKLGKAIFVKELHEMVGREMVGSAFKEIRG